MVKFEHVHVMGGGGCCMAKFSGTMDNGYTGLSPPSTDRLTQLKTLPSRNFVGGR